MKSHLYTVEMNGRDRFGMMSGLLHRIFGIFRIPLKQYLLARVYFGRSAGTVPPGSLVIFPCRQSTLCCGLAGLVSFKKPPESGKVNLLKIKQLVDKVEETHCRNCRERDASIQDHHFGGNGNVLKLFNEVALLKRNDRFFEILVDPEIETNLADLRVRLEQIIGKETDVLSANMGFLASDEVDIVSRRTEDLKDIAWCLEREIAGNVAKVKALAGDCPIFQNPSAAQLYKELNAVLNSLDRLEVRGRDSAGISIMFHLARHEFDAFMDVLRKAGLSEELQERSKPGLLLNRCITLCGTAGTTENALATIIFTYKIAAEIGRLGDNILFLRAQIQDDRILQALVLRPHEYRTISAHTRWASVGAITGANCHPVDNALVDQSHRATGTIHACLNGDIDNYLELGRNFEGLIHSEITTDTKIIPLQIQSYVAKGCPIGEAFWRSVNDFKGSHAILMHTDLAPGKLFLAQRGSGQALFVGLADDHYISTSEVYGFIEETSRYLKLEGDVKAEGGEGKPRGQIYILDQDSGGGVPGIKAMDYDGTPIHITEADIKLTPIHSRDIDRQGYPHYFLKEISESPVSVERTLMNRWKIVGGDERRYTVTLDRSVIPESIETALREKTIRRIFFVGQGTAGVAALACTEILNHYLQDPSFQVAALKASELSGFRLSAEAGDNGMSDTLVIAITQSGTTTDTNRTMAMVKERGAYTMAIVNRRDSDITFLVDGVMHTSSGRDIEMSVASTKAFYSQIVAGALLGLRVAAILGRRDEEFITAEVKRLISLPDQMRQVLQMGDSIEQSARRLALRRTYWAAVGSGPNKAAADEIRIKLSELCYKTISSDFIEDKKHIDLSSEPLIFVCAAGTNGSVIGDIIKDTAIFRAHKAAPIVVATAGEHRFSPYAEDVFHVPEVSQHLAPILNTLVGHLWGYYAALSINDSSRLLYDFKKDIQDTIERFSAQGMDVYEIVLEKAFKEKIAAFYKEFRRERRETRLPATMGLKASSDLTLLLKYLSGRLPVSDFELDFGIKGTALNMLNALFTTLAESIDATARSIDAIKHQAKTVTVGTSRMSEKVEGILFNALAQLGFFLSQLTTNNVIVLKNLQNVVSRVNGMILYKIGGLSLLGEPTEESTIRVMRKTGILQEIPSRVERDIRLAGSKRIVASQGNVYIGKGLRDGRSIILIPLISLSPSTPNIIEHILLLNISFQEAVALQKKVKALGGKYEHIKNIVTENSVPWEDRYLEMIPIQELFGKSAEKIGESIMALSRRKLHVFPSDTRGAAHREEPSRRAFM